MADAWLYLVAAPGSANVSGLDDDEGIPLLPESPLTIGRTPTADVVVNEPMIGGRRNSTVSCINGVWRYRHLGHGLPIFHNERAVTGNPGGGNGDPPLVHGDVVGPFSVNGEPIVFLFVLAPGSGRSRAEALPPIEAAIAAAFPDRAALLADVRRWFVSEPLASDAALSRVLHCALCSRFRRRDAVVDLERVREEPAARVQVLADSQGRIGAATDPSITLCETCLEDPESTFRRAHDADRVRADLQRALVAADIATPIVEELERRFASAQPRAENGRCSLCEREGAVLRGSGRRAVCLACLRASSAIRHIRG